MLAGVALAFIRRRGANSLLLALLGSRSGAPRCSGCRGSDAKPATVSVMTRNLYLGADLTPGVQAANLQGLVDAAGDDPRAGRPEQLPGAGQGTRGGDPEDRPDLVGLQEVALWRTAPCTENPIPPKATQVRYDYLALLLKQLNKGKKLYRAVITQPEFDFEVYANTDANESTAAAGCPMGSELNGRLTMRDVILARSGVKTSKAKGAHFATQLQVRPAGVSLNVTRGWTRVDARWEPGRSSAS